MDRTSEILLKLMRLEEFKIECRDTDLIFSSGGHQYHCGHYSNVQESILEAYIHFYARIQAKELVKSAKITIE